MSTNQAETAEELFNTLTDCIIFIGDLGYVLTQGELVRVRDGFRNMQARNNELEVSSEDNARACESAVKKWNELEAENKLLREEWERMRTGLQHYASLPLLLWSDKTKQELGTEAKEVLASLKFSPDHA